MESNPIFRLDGSEFIGDLGEVINFMRSIDPAQPYPIPPAANNPDEITVYRVRRIEGGRFELIPAINVGYYIVEGGDVHWKELDPALIVRDPAEVASVARRIMMEYNTDNETRERFRIMNADYFNPFRLPQHFDDGRRYQAVCSQCCQIKLFGSPSNYVSRRGWRVSFACLECRRRIESWARGPGAPWNLDEDYWKPVQEYGIWFTSTGFVFNGVICNSHGWRPYSLLGEIGNHGYMTIPRDEMCPIADDDAPPDPAKLFKYQNVCVQRLVYEAFHNIPIGRSPKSRMGPNGRISVVIAHRDDNKCNNAVRNLLCITQTENIRMAIGRGRLEAPRGRHPNRGIITEIVFRDDHFDIRRYVSAYRVEKDRGVKRNTVLGLCKGRIVNGKHYILQFGELIVRAVRTTNGYSTFIFE
jgi:hypothetical protein